MIDLLRDPLTQVVLAVLAIIVSIAIYLTQRSRKKLSYEIVYDFPLLSMTEQMEGMIQILFEGKPVRNVFLFLMRLFNSGNIPILTDDFETPITVSFGAGVRILRAQPEPVPEEMQASISIQDHCIVINPTLLNSGDSISIRCLLSEYDGALRVNARIAGIKEIKEEPASYLSLYRLFDKKYPGTIFLSRMRYIILGALMVGVGSAIKVSLKDPPFNQLPPTVQDLIPFLFWTIGVFFVSWVFLGTALHRRLILLDVKNLLRKWLRVKTT